MTGGAASYLIILHTHTLKDTQGNEMSLLIQVFSKLWITSDVRLKQHLMLTYSYLPAIHKQYTQCYGIDTLTPTRLISAQDSQLQATPLYGGKWTKRTRTPPTNVSLRGAHCTPLPPLMSPSGGTLYTTSPLPLRHMSWILSLTATHWQ